MRRLLIFGLLAGLFSINLISCDGGGGEGGKGEKEFTVFDVVINIDGVEVGVTDCPDSANLKLSLIISGNNISGLAELVGLGKIGDAKAISGLIEDNNFTLEQFGVAVISDVPPDAEFPASSISFNFQEFQGVFMDENEDGLVDRMEGKVSGKVFENQGDLVVCDSEEFAGEFSGEARSPKGCVSPVEAPTLECPAEGFVNQCDAYSFYFCFGWCEPYDDGQICIDPIFYASNCGVIDCLTVRCPIGIVNLEQLEDFRSFQYVTPQGDTQTWVGES